MTRRIHLTQGDEGPQVRDLQRRLARVLSVDLRSEDGRFGSQTLDAVRRFQRDRGLRADGVVGHETWRNLVEAGWALGDRLLWRSGTAMRGDDVLELQRLLNRLGFNAGPEDGIFGPLTASAVEEFQRNVGLTVDGVAGPETVGGLRRVQRQHQAPGLAVRVREREWLRTLTGRGLSGARILVDPARGPRNPGAVGPGGATEASVTWEIATRLAARLSAAGAATLLSRGPATDPTPSQRARIANEQGIELVVSVAMNALANPVARGVATYYFGTPRSSSEAGWRLADLLHDHLVDAGWGPSCGVHQATWTLLRETRMPAVVVEPAFLTSPLDEARLTSPRGQDRLAGVLAAAIAQFFDVPASTPVDLAAVER